MNILVIGGNGLFGRKTVIQLAQDKEINNVVSMDVVPTKEWVLKEIGRHSDKYKFVRGDVSYLEDILTAIKQFSIDRIINFAFILPGETMETNPRLAVKVNELGMCNSFEAARLMGISRVVYASSEGVYGPQDEYGNRDVTEEDKMHPGSAYAIAKQLSELLAAQYDRLYGINFSALRPCIGYGHGGLTPPLIKQFCDLVSLPATGKTFTTEDDGTLQVSLSSADDVAALAIKLIKLPSSPHPAYNVGGAPTSMIDVAKVIRKYIPEANIRFGKQPPLTPDRGLYGIPWKISSKLAEKDLGFSLLPLDKAVLLHINDARTEAGLPLFTC
jgi:nucleoside-diphosphate-sugar epimerase